MPDGPNGRDPLLPKRSGDLWIDLFKPHGAAQDFDDPVGERWSQPRHQSLSEGFKHHFFNADFGIRIAEFACLPQVRNLIPHSAICNLKLVDLLYLVCFPKSHPVIFELKIVESSIFTTECYQFLMSPFLNNLTVRENNDSMSISDR